jgi:hypothetical protein
VTHNLKTDPEPFQASWDGLKTCEIRKSDRHFQVGDYLMLLETTFTGHQMALIQDGKQVYPLRYTGRSICARITHVLPGPCYGIAPGYVVLSLDITNAQRTK